MRMMNDEEHLLISRMGPQKGQQAHLETKA